MALRLGDICHRILDFIVRQRLLFEEDWRNALKDAWEREVGAEAEAQRAGRAGSTYQSPESWPEFQVKRARLFKIASRIRAQLISIPAADIVTEEPLAARDAKLQGIADLLIRQPGNHRIVDYKSGRAVDRQTRNVQPSYQRQLQLYALMEAESSHEWPDAAELLPLEGPSVSVRVEESECHALGDEAVELLAAYNTTVPGEQPPHVSPETCPVCPFITRCEAFWTDVSSEEWGDVFLAVSGQVRQVTSTPLGGVSVTVDVARGSVETRSVKIRNINPADHPAAKSLNVGDAIFVAGLREEFARGTFMLPRFGRLRRGL